MITAIVFEPELPIKGEQRRIVKETVGTQSFDLRREGERGRNDMGVDLLVGECGLANPLLGRPFDIDG
jgi:hypothetical protein